MKLERPRVLELGGKASALPLFFPSVSSLKTSMRPAEYVEALGAMRSRCEHFLVSSYDVENAEPEERLTLLKAISDARIAGARVVLDSGNYEGYWRTAGVGWTEVQFHRALGRNTADLAFGFDSHRDRRTGGKYLADAVAQHERDVAAAGAIKVAPIIHGEREALARGCVALVLKCGAEIVAVAERELGESIVERLATVREIRDALDEAKDGVVLHLLGTGNPTSISLFVAAGADSFDGLEWCQTVVDFDSGELSHLSHYDFFRGQTAYAQDAIPPRLAVLGHNLEFMHGWMNGIRAAVCAGEIEMFCRLRLSERVVGTVEGVLWQS